MNIRDDIRRQYNLLRNFRNWWIYYADKLHISSPREFRFITRAGVSVRVPRSLYPEFKSIFLREHYLEGLASPLPPHPTVVDVGANIGFFTLFAASKWGAKVYAYEPVSANFRTLENNVRANPALPVRCRHMAVSGVSGNVDLSWDPRETVTASATAFPSGDRMTQTESVPGITLREILETEGLESVDLLKLDCEGSEFPILYQSSPETLKAIGRLAAEIHENRSVAGHDAPTLQRFLESNGFTVRTNGPGTYLWAWQAGGEAAEPPPAACRTDFPENPPLTHSSYR